MLYILTTFLAAVLLRLPIFHKPGVSLSFIDSLFTAASSVSVTGLSVVTVHEVFNNGGIVLLTVLFQIGGIGIMTLSTLFWLLFGQRIGLEQRMVIATDHNRPGLSGLVQLMRSILMIALIIELIGTVLLGTYTWLAGYHDHWYTAYFNSFFTSVSAFTNAGFFLQSDSMISYANDYIYQVIVMFLIISGAIGFPVLLELKRRLVNRKQRQHFSLFTKITTLTFAVLIVVGALLFYVFEQGRFLQDKSWHESFFYALFHSVSSRSGGLSTMDISLLSTSTMMMLSGLMFIGASPSSVGGGIRTTTFFVLVAAVFAYMRGYKEVKVFGRELEEDDIKRAFIVFFAAIGLIFTSVLLLTAFEDIPFERLLFEVCSAFGTTGLSAGITETLGTASKIVLIITMIIGRIGLVNLLLLKKDDQPVRIRYPKEHVIVGQ
ncbi:TrkH family potassium uptake protein [Paenibacillus mendelii]|uniref:TrkH family potassium uptake protein n=1 Tax=Paenibacillus mendelii TaxID=206163 RepID=A0ABV6JJM5_9BACL|nr:TrkH family potassium uptake protein [Paenibacillus mendelii]MCQ6559050.1 TrkH family potassium uptake protein [Paenibacillus mendelii]